MAYKVGVNDCKIAPWTATGSYGTAVDVPAIQEATIAITTDKGELKGDDGKVDVFSYASGGTIALRHGMNTGASVSSDVLSTLTGVTSASSTSTATRTRVIPDAQNFPYLGVAVKQRDTGSGGDMHLLALKAKVMDGFSYVLSQGQYNIQNLNLEMVADGGNLLQQYDHLVEQALTIPLAAA